MRFWVAKSSKQPEKKTQDSTRPYSVQDLIDAYYQNSWHARCINLKTICILGDGIENPEVVKKLQECVRGDSVFTLLHKTILDLRIFGDAFWEVVKTGSGVEIYHVPSWTVSLGKDGGWVQELGNKKVEFKAEDLWHFLEPGMLSQVWGCPDYLQLINDATIESISTIKTFNNNFFKNNAIPDGILFVKGGDIAPTTQYGLQRFFRSKYQGVENASKFCIAPVPEGVELQLERLQDTKDGKFMELKDSLVMEILSCHGIPPRLASILIPGSLGGGGEASGELKIFLQTLIKPLQNIFGGQLDSFFGEVLEMKTDISFKAFDVMPSESEIALNALRG